MNEVKKLDNKVHEILELLNKALDLRKVAEMEILSDEEKQPIIDKAWRIIDKIHEISEREKK